MTEFVLKEELCDPHSGLKTAGRSWAGDRLLHVQQVPNTPTVGNLPLDAGSKPEQEEGAVEE